MSEYDMNRLRGICLRVQSGDNPTTEDIKFLIEQHKAIRSTYIMTWDALAEIGRRANQ